MVGCVAACGESRLRLLPLHSLPWTLRALQPDPEKFDLNALPGKTVTFFVSDAGPALYATNDSFPSVLSQIRQAALAWDSVQTSDLRVAFGGLYTDRYGTIVAWWRSAGFDELPPGVLGFGGPTATGEPVTGAEWLLCADRSRHHSSEPRSYTTAGPQLY